MKFILHLGHVVSVSPTEREQLRPIAHRTDKIQLPCLRGNIRS
jgi:hypothetical protein